MLDMIFEEDREACLSPFSPMYASARLLLVIPTMAYGGIINRFLKFLSRQAYALPTRGKLISGHIA